MMAISQHVLFRETKRGLIRFLFVLYWIVFPDRALNFFCLGFILENQFSWACVIIHIFVLDWRGKNVGSVLFKWIDVDLYQKFMWKRIRKIADSVVSIRNLKWKSMILIMNCQKIYEECCGVYAVGNFRNSKVIEAYVQTKCRRYTRMVKCCLALTI